MTNQPANRGNARLILSDMVEVAAPIEPVWSVLTDFAEYGQWNPLCRHIEVEARPGGLVRMLIDDPRTGGLEQFDYRLSAMAAPARLAWEKDFPGIGLWARRDQMLQPLAPNRSLYLTTDLYDGPGAPAAFTENAQ